MMGGRIPSAESFRGGHRAQMMWTDVGRVEGIRPPDLERGRDAWTRVVRGLAEGKLSPEEYRRILARAAGYPDAAPEDQIHFEMPALSPEFLRRLIEETDKLANERGLAGGPFDPDLPVLIRRDLLDSLIAGNGSSAPSAFGFRPRPERTRNDGRRSTAGCATKAECGGSAVDSESASKSMKQDPVPWWPRAMARGRASGRSEAEVESRKPTCGAARLPRPQGGRHHAPRGSIARSPRPSSWIAEWSPTRSGHLVLQRRRVLPGLLHQLGGPEHRGWRVMASPGPHLHPIAEGPLTM
jgi:hypothetical protein